MGNLVDPPDHRRCTAKANRSGARCRKAAIAGGKVCRSHGGGAVQVQRRAAERRALEQARALLDTERDADPAKVLAACVKAGAAILHGARAALAEDDADDLDLRNLAEAAALAARLARLALDAAPGVIVNAQLQGELVGGLLRRVVEAAQLPRELENRLYVSLAAELRALPDFKLGESSETRDLLKIDADIAMLEAELRRAEQVEAAERMARELPEKLAGAVSAGFSVLDLDEQAQERVTAAVEGFLRLDAETTSAPTPTPTEPTAGQWWLARYQRRQGNGR